MLIAQVSDPHVKAPGQLAYRRVDTTDALARCVAALLRLTPRPDAVVATGDLADGGRPEEYRHLAELLAPLPMPVYLVPGNHDERAALVEGFPHHAYLPRGDRFLQYAIDDHPVRLLGLDTLVPGAGHGLVCDERLAWLDARLAEAPGRPTVVFMHHPPFDTGIGHMDAQRLRGAPAMAEVVRRHPQVERVLCGHLHRPIQVRWAGTVASTAPSPAHQVALDLRPDGPGAFCLEPGAYQLHLWRAGTGLISHTGYVDAFDGPYSFRGGVPLPV